MGCWHTHARFDGSFTCECAETKYTGENCELETVRASETDDAIIPVSAAAAAFLIAIVLLLVLHKPYKRARQRRRKRTLVQGLRKDVDNLKEQVALSGFNVASSSYHGNPLRIYLTETMHTAAKLDELQHISELVEMGADPSVGDEFDQSVHASLLESYEVRLKNGEEPHPAMRTALLAVFQAHLEISVSIAALMRRQTAATDVVTSVLVQLATVNWRSGNVSSETVLHRIVEACLQAALREAQAVSLVSAVLSVSKQDLIATNTRGRTPGDASLACEAYPRIQRMLSVVLFDDYLIMRPTEPPIYKSSTAALFECRVLESMDDFENLLEEVPDSADDGVPTQSESDGAFARITQTSVAAVSSAAKFVVGAVSSAARFVADAIPVGRHSNTDRRESIISIADRPITEDAEERYRKAATSTREDRRHGRTPILAEQMVIKLMKDEVSWTREIKSRCILPYDKATSITVSLESAAAIGRGIRCPESETDVHIIDSIEVMSKNHARVEALDLMREFPFSLCMPLASSACSV